MVLSKEHFFLVLGDIDRLRPLLPTLKQTLSPGEIGELCSLACGRKRNVEMAKLLFAEFEIDPCCTKLCTNTPVSMAIHAACWLSDLEMIKFLVEQYGCRVDQYCISLASDTNATDIHKLAFLLANGANATGVVDASGNTPLRKAFSIEAVQFLLTTACNKDNQAVHAMLTAKNYKGRTASQSILFALPSAETGFDVPCSCGGSPGFADHAP